MTKLGSYTAAGAALAGACLLAYGRHPRARLALLGAGFAGLGAAVAVQRASAHDPAVYQPADTLKPLADGIWIVDSGPLHGFVPLRMTVIRLPDGGVLLHSPTPPTAALRAELDRIGPVTVLVAPNSVHWLSLPDWQRAYPQAVTWAAPGLRQRKQVRRAGVVVDHELNEAPPAEWADVLELIPVPGGLGFREIAFFHKPSRTLVLTDLVLNLEEERIPAALRPGARLLGVTAPGGRAPVYVRAVFLLGGKAARRGGARLVELAPQRVVFAHGRIFESNATGQLARSLSWLLPAGRR